MSIEARQIKETLYSYAAILNFTPSPQGLRAKFGACSVQNAQLFFARTISRQLFRVSTNIVRAITNNYQQITNRPVELPDVYKFCALACKINF